jgi:hypothetical protein
MLTPRTIALALTPAFIPAFMLATACGDCQWHVVPTPDYSDTLNVFTASESSPQALHALLIAGDSDDPHILRREADAWDDLGGPGLGSLDAPPSYLAIHADEQGRVWLGGMAEYDLQEPPVIAEFDDGWLDPQTIDLINQLKYPFYDRGGRVYAIDTAPDGTMFAVGIALGYGFINDDDTVPLLLVNSGSGWVEVVDTETDWPGGFTADTYLNDVIAFSSTNVWAVGQHAAEDGAYSRGGLIVHWDGASFTIFEDPRTGGDFVRHPLVAMAANGPDDIWAVGGSFFNPQTSTIAHYDGTSWTRMESPLSVPLRSLALDDDGTAWAAPVNFGGDVAFYDGAQWTETEPPVSNASLTAISRDPDGTVWMLGTNTDDESLAVRLDCAADADLDGDGVVGVNDLLMLLANWGACPPDPPCTGDLDGDGQIGVTDLLQLLSEWGE